MHRGRRATADPANALGRDVHGRSLCLEFTLGRSSIGGDTGRVMDHVGRWDSRPQAPGHGTVGAESLRGRGAQGPGGESPHVWPCPLGVEWPRGPSPGTSRAEGRLHLPRAPPSLHSQALLRAPFPRLGQGQGPAMPVAGCRVPAGGPAPAPGPRKPGRKGGRRAGSRLPNIQLHTEDLMPQLLGRGATPNDRLSP